MGNSVLVSSVAPLHYEKDGELVKIDNSLVESEKDSSIFTNESNAFCIELRKAITKESYINLN